MAYLEQAFRGLYEEDGVLVMARGTGLEQIFTLFLRVLCEEECPLEPNEVAKGEMNKASKGRRLCFAINCTGMETAILNSLRYLGVPEASLPVVVTSDLSIRKREELYRQGGVYIVTSLILNVDMINKVMDVSAIGGLLVWRAHRMPNSSREEFIVKLYRESNRAGFVKAFSDDPESMIKGFGRVEKVLRALQVRQVYLWPRFQTDVLAALAKNEPVVEKKVEQTKDMRDVQEAVLCVLQACLDELKRAAPCLNAADLNMKSALRRGFDASLRLQMEEQKLNAQSRARALARDVGVLLRVLGYVSRYDCVTFLSYLQAIETASTATPTTPSWVLQEEGSELFRMAKERVFRVVTKGPAPSQPLPARILAEGSAEDAASSYKLDLRLEPNSKWTALRDNLRKIRREEVKLGRTHPNRPARTVLVIVRDLATAGDLAEACCLGVQEMMHRRFTNYLHQLHDRVHRARATRLSSRAGQRGKSDKRMRSATSDSTASATPRRMVRSSDVERVLLLQEYEQRRADDAGSILATNAVASSSRSHKRNQGHGQNRYPALRAAREARTSFASSISADLSSCGIELPFHENGGKSWAPLKVLIITAAQMAQHIDILDEKQPSDVILYDPEISLVRAVELHNSMRAPSLPALNIYFMMYDECLDRTQYDESRQSEDDAFDRLIKHREIMVLPTFDRGPKQLQGEDLPLSMDTRTVRRGRPKTNSSRKLIIDVREFRSMLPCVLHSRGFDIVAATIHVGDFILSREICVERKSVSDLKGSLESGRLYTQVEAMCKWYKIPVLLIEFGEGKPFELQSPEDAGKDKDLVPKLSVLVIHFPRLRILWSRSAHATATLFEDLMSEAQPIDVDYSLAAGVAGKGSTPSDGSENSAAVRFLKKLPGVEDGNFRAIMRKVRCVADLCNLSRGELKEVLGEINSRRLHKVLTWQMPM